MYYEFYFPTLVACFVLACWGLVILGRHLRERNRLRAHELLQAERKPSMQNEAANPALSPAATLVTDPVRERSPDELLAWVRIAALCLGLFLLFTGIGMLLAFRLIPDFHEIEAVGFIPALSGVGLLLFVRLSRHLEPATRPPA